MKITDISWRQIEEDIQKLALQITAEREYIGDPKTIIAIGRGGYIPGVILSHHFDSVVIPCKMSSYKNGIKDHPANIVLPDLVNVFGSVFIVDDLSDTGDTLKIISDWCKEHIDNDRIFTATLYIKEDTSFRPDFYADIFPSKTWLRFPWESKTKI